MRIKGALHVHSNLSHDGALPIQDVARFYQSRGYHFIAMAEHSQDMDEQKITMLKEQSAECSDDSFCVIPGVEFSCRGGIHIFGFAAVGTTSEVDPVAVVREIHALHGLAILAHPGRQNWEVTDELLLAADGAEIWNLRYDGKYLPSFRASSEFEKMRRINPRLLATAGHDFHRDKGYYDARIEMEVDAPRPATIFDRIRQGAYEIRSPFFHSSAHPNFTWYYALRVNLMSRQLALLKKARDLLVRWSA